MKFGEAIERMRMGSFMRRQGWNGVGMWIALVPEAQIPLDKVDPSPAASSPLGRALHDAREGGLKTLSIPSYFVMRAADRSYVHGWLASQTDMAAEDWIEVEAPKPR